MALWAVGCRIVERSEPQGSREAHMPELLFMSVLAVEAIIVLAIPCVLVALALRSGPAHHH